MPNQLNRTSGYAYKCVLESCGKKKTPNETVSFFAFPKDPARCAIWLKNCKLSADILSTKNIKLCGKHFESKMFLNNLENRLQPFAIPKPLSGDFLEDQSSSTDYLPEKQSSSPDNLPAEQSSSPDGLPEKQSSSPDDLPEEQSSSPDGLPEKQSSSPDNFPKEQSSSPDGLPEKQSSSPDNFPKEQSSSPDGLPVKQSSSPDDLPEEQSSSPVGLPEERSSSPEDLPEVQSSSPDDFPEDQTSSPEDLPVGQSSSPEDLPKEQSSSPDDFPEKQSSSPDDLPEEKSSSPEDLPVGQSSSPEDFLEGQSSSPEVLPEGQSSSPEDFPEEKIFDWNKYLTARNAEEVPEDFFYHICKSELNGIEIGSVVEIENEDQSGYWFASVCSSKGVLMNLHYFGDDNDQHTFWLEVKSPRIHSLNWGSENNKKLIPPYPERFSRYKPEVIQEKVQDCEHVISNAVLQMGGAPIHNIFKCNMFVEVQDREYPYRVWISKVLKNVGGRLFLQMQGISSPEEKPFWLFYLNERVFPLGWAEQKGLPWRVMNLDASLKNSIDSSVLLNVLKPKTPKQHSYKVGEMLEVINPYSMMVFYVGTIVKIYDNRYFKVEVDNEIDENKRINFVATKESPYLFQAGWASKHKFLLKTPTDWNEPYKFCWSKYLIRKDAKFASVDNSCRKKINKIHIGMKLEAVDPLNTDCIRVATVKGFADHWVFLSFDRTSCRQELLHLRSVYSDEVFPVGWCNKHNYSLGVPKLPYNDSNDFEHCYYSSDVDIDLSQSDQDYLAKYPRYLKGDIFYHFSKKDKQSYDDGFEEIEDDYIKSEDSDSDSDSDKYIPTTSEIEIKEDEYDNDPILDAKDEPELDEEFHDALFSDEKVDIKPEEDDIKPEEVDNIPEEVDNKLKKINNAKEVNLKKRKKVYHDGKSIENMFRNSSKLFSKNSYKMCIYFNKDCYPGGHVVKKKIPSLPNCIGPGPVSSILREALTLFVDLDYFPWNALKKIKKIQNMLFNGPGGVEMWITTSAKRTRGSSSNCLLLPETRKMAKSYCSALCNLSGMCEFFMTTEETKCPHGCHTKASTIPPLQLKMDNLPIHMTSKIKYHRLNDAQRSAKIACRKITHSEISRIGKKVLERSNKPLVSRYKHYLGSILNLDAHIFRLNRSPTELESSLITEIIARKNTLKRMDKMEVFSNTKSNVETSEEKLFVVLEDWKSTFENYYRQNPRFKKFKIDIGQLEHIRVTSNPKYWSAEDVYKYLTNDLFCKDVGLKLYAGQVDGVAFMLLNEEQLLLRLRCTINLAIRIMCHVAQVKYVCLTKYCNVNVD